jgi:hypothetical protein
MSYIYVKAIPNYIPVTTKGHIHYCNLEFIVYKSELSPALNREIRNYKAMEEGIKKGPEITISARTALPDSIDSKEALCVTNDIPSAGYAYHYPEGWGCTHTSEDAALTFVISAPVSGGESFETAVIRVDEFLTTAREGACALHVSVKNFQAYIPDAEDSEFTVIMSQKYNLEILNFTANSLTGKFFCHHDLPVLFHWDAVCDVDTPLTLLEDGISIGAVQEFSGEKLLRTREGGDHTYTLKMTLPAGEKTENIVIRDTRWRKLEAPAGLTPDFSLPGRFLAYHKMIYLFYGGKVYQSEPGKDHVWSEWKTVCNYDGSVIYPAVTALAVMGDMLCLAGGTKSDSGKLFYSTYNLKKGGNWTDHDMQQSGELAGGAMACDTSGSGWIVYAKWEGDYIVFLEYDPETQGFIGKYGLKIPGMKYAEFSIRKKKLYLAAATEDEILLKQLKKEDIGFCDIGVIEAETSPEWMRWAEGSNGMFLWTDKGLYRGSRWKITEYFQPPWQKGTYPWCGGVNKKLISLLAGEEKAGAVQAWETDVLQ